MNNIAIQVPEKANRIIHTLQAAGYEAYVVGGCVRDAILGRVAADWDITTSALPHQVKELFRRTIDTGIQHGTVTIMLDKEGFEVTTYRVDGEYEDGRHPKEVLFTPCLTEDLKRRDFTINAMAYNDRDGLVDVFGGVSDLEHGIIRCVGEAMERFSEDALRILRAVRFSAQLGFAIEANTRKAMEALAGNLKKISAERIQVELVKLLTSPHPEILRTAWETGITAVVLPEFDCCMEMPLTMQADSFHIYNVGTRTLRGLTCIRNDKVLRLTMLCHDFGMNQSDDHGKKGEEIAAQVLHRLKFDNDTLRKVKRLVRYHNALVEDPTPCNVRRAIYRIGEDLFSMYLEVCRADILTGEDSDRQEQLERLDRTEAVYNQVLDAKDCLSLKTLAVSGNDLMQAGVKPGKMIGVVLNALLELVIDHPEYNQKEELLARVPEILAQNE